MSVPALVISMKAMQISEGQRADAQKLSAKQQAEAEQVKAEAQRAQAQAHQANTAAFVARVTIDDKRALVGSSLAEGGTFVTRNGNTLPARIEIVLSPRS